MRTCTHKMLKDTINTLIESLCSSAYIQRCAGYNTDKQKDSNVKGGVDRRANGLVAGLHNPVLQFVGILSLQSKQSQCPLTPVP